MSSENLLINRGNTANMGNKEHNENNNQQENAYNYNINVNFNNNDNDNNSNQVEKQAQHNSFFKHKSQNHFRSTSMNCGPYSNQQKYNVQSNKVNKLINKNADEKAYNPFFPPSNNSGNPFANNNISHSKSNSKSTTKFNRHNNEIINDFRRKSETIQYKPDKPFSKTFTNNLKQIEIKSNKDIFTKTKTIKRYYLNRDHKNYDGFDGYSIPKLQKRCSTALVGGKTSFYDKNYQKLINSILCKNKKIDNNEEEKLVDKLEDIEKICEIENNNIKSIIKSQIKIPIIHMKENPTFSKIHVGPKIIFSKDHLNKGTSKTVQKSVETSHIPHIEGSTFVTNLNRNNYT